MSAEPLIGPGPRLDDGEAALALHTTVTALLGFVTTAAWRLTPAGRGRALGIHAAITGVVAVVLVVLWLLTGRHGAWPGVALLGPAAVLGTHVAVRAVWLRRGG